MPLLIYVDVLKAYFEISYLSEYKVRESLAHSYSRSTFGIHQTFDGLLSYRCSSAYLLIQILCEASLGKWRSAYIFSNTFGIYRNSYPFRIVIHVTYCIYVIAIYMYVIQYESGLENATVSSQNMAIGLKMDNVYNEFITHNNAQ